MPTLSPNARVLWIGGACALTVLMIWSSFIIIARYSASRTLLPFDIAFLRFAFSAAVVAAIVLWRRRGANPWRTALTLRQIAVLTLSAGIGYCTLAYSGFFFAPAAHAAVLLPGSLPLWTAIMAVVLLGERLTRARLLGLALIVVGDLLVGGASLWQAMDGGQAWKGDLLFLAAAACWGLYTVMCRRWNVGAVDATFCIALGCGLSFVPLYALGALQGWWPSQLAAAPWTEIAWQAVYQGGLAMLIAGIAFTQVVRSFGPVVTTMLTALVPPLAALAAVPLLGEPLRAPALLGLACVTAGLLLGVSAQWLALRARTA